MISFVSEKLKEEVIELLNFYKEKRIHHYFYEMEEWDIHEEDLIIDYDEIFEFSLSYDVDDHEINLKEAIDIKNSILDSKLDGHIYRGKNKFIMRVASSDIQCDLYTYEMKIPYDMKTMFIYKGKKYYIDLIDRSVEYAMAVYLSDEYDKYMPPTLMGEDLFIHIYCEDGLDENIDAIIERYIFEVDSVFGIRLFSSPRPVIDYYEDEDDNDTNYNRKIINTEVNDNLIEILSIFNKASNIESIESKILNYTRVIEYASQTGIKKDLFESVLNKLSSDRVYNPDSDYIIELEQIFKDNNKYSKDSEAIKITVEQCCDAMNLKSHAPEFLKKINKLKIDSKKSEQSEALEELGKAIADTRNMFSHAKTNYTKKGMECPKEQLFKFGEFMKAVANQVIRWYARQSNTYIIK